MGLDWDTIRRQREARLVADIVAGGDGLDVVDRLHRLAVRGAHETGAPVPAKQVTRRRRSGQERGVGRLYDHAEIARRYTAGERIKDLAEAFGCGRSRIYVALENHGVELDPRRRRGMKAGTG